MNVRNLINGEWRASGSDKIIAINPATKQTVQGEFIVATDAEIDEAIKSAWSAWTSFRFSSGDLRAQLLRDIANEIENLGDKLVFRVIQETGLPEGRVKGERGRTCAQLRLFADLVQEGSWQDATIDEALPDRQPIPRPDIRRMKIGLGPVAIFTASNFPLAFSTAGGDTASALAAGCPVIVKAHPSHPGTNALVSQAINRAVLKSDLPAGVFSTINGGIDVGTSLVRHSCIKAVGFTGSYKGGKALMDIAAQRQEPIPVYAEMGSNNPIFILPEKISSEKDKLATIIASSVNLGAGQFCTNPGVLVVKKANGLKEFVGALKEAFKELEPSVMLNNKIYEAYENGRMSCSNVSGVDMLYQSKSSLGDWIANPSLGMVTAKDFTSEKSLQDEVFGPFTLLVVCEDDNEFINVAECLHGQLTCTIIGNSNEIEEAGKLTEVLTMKCGRLLYNGVPTGVEVSHAMHHGGPFPSSSNGMYTSVGTAAIERFARSVCFQNAPEKLLPDAIKTGNPLNIWRTVNGVKTRS